MKYNVPAPAGGSTLTVTSSDIGEGTVTAQGLTTTDVLNGSNQRIGFSYFVAAGQSPTIRVIVTGVDDSVVDGNITYPINIAASNIAVPLWTDFMREALKSYPVREFSPPAKIEFAKVDAMTGYLALPTCPKVILEAYREGTVPQEFCPYQHLGESGGDEVIDE